VALCLLGLLAQQASQVQAQDWITIAKALDPGNQILGDWQNNQNPCGEPPFTVRVAAAREQRLRSALLLSSPQLNLADALCAEA